MLIICNGMPRSGSTLQYNIAKNIIEMRGVGKAEGFFFEEQLVANKEIFEEWGRDSVFHVIKIHQALPYAAKFDRNGISKTLYIYRDLRDVAVSIKRMFSLDGQALYASLKKAVDNYYQIVSYNLLLKQKYEDVILDLRRCVIDVAKFLEIDLCEDDILKICGECNIDTVAEIATTVNKSPGYAFKHAVLNFGKKMKLKNILLSIGISPNVVFKLRKFLSETDKNTLLHQNHISPERGKAGVWEAALTAEEVATIQDHFRDWFLKENYRI